MGKPRDRLAAFQLDVVVLVQPVVGAIDETSATTAFTPTGSDWRRQHAICRSAPPC